MKATAKNEPLQNTSQACGSGLANPQVAGWAPRPVPIWPGC